MRVKDIISHLKRFPKKKAAVIESLKEQSPAPKKDKVPAKSKG